MKNWNYAQATHLMKEKGGPKAFIDAVYQKGREVGRREGTIRIIPITGGLIALGIVIDKIIYKISKNSKEEKTKTKEGKELAENLNNQNSSENYRKGE